MTYDIYKEDVLDKKPEKGKKKKLPKLTIKPFYIHLSILILLGLVILYFILFSVPVENSTNKSSLILVGDVAAFSKTYQGNLEVYSSKFFLTTSTGSFDGENTDFEIKKFNGIIHATNRSMIFEGTASEIKFGNSELTPETAFRLESTMKTSTYLYLEKLDLFFDKGRIKFADQLNYDFTNTTIQISKFNTSIHYDGSYTFSGYSPTFNLSNPNGGISLSFKE